MVSYPRSGHIIIGVFIYTMCLCSPLELLHVHVHVCAHVLVLVLSLCVQRPIVEFALEDSRAIKYRAAKKQRQVSIMTLSLSVMIIIHYATVSEKRGHSTHKLISITCR